LVDFDAGGFRELGGFDVGLVGSGDYFYRRFTGIEGSGSCYVAVYSVYVQCNE
jgi:hypothetical protein